MIRFVSSSERYDAVTHGGTHHADDVFSMALMEYLYDDVRILRIPYDTDSMNVTNSAIIFDTLGGKYDHHQKGGNGYHPLIQDGKKPIPYASFGLLWKDYGMKILGKKGIRDKRFVYDFIENNLVKVIDAADNGIYPRIADVNVRFRIPSISFIISLLNEDDSIRPSDDNKNQGLKLAISLAKNTIEVMIKYALRGKIPASVPRPLNSDILDILRKKVLTLYKEIGIEPTNIYGWNNLFDAVDNLCNRLFTENYEDASKFLKAFINGLRYDSLRSHNIYEVSQEYDKMYVLTISDIFDKSTYGKTYKEDLSKIIVKICDNMIASCIYKVTSKKYVTEQIKKQSGSRILVLDKKAYWQDFVAKSPDAKSFWFVVSPSDQGYKVQPIPCRYHENGYKKGFPSKWYGYRKGDFQGSIPDGVIFIHSVGFLAICSDKESAVRLCQNAFTNHECRRIPDAV